MIYEIKDPDVGRDLVKVAGIVSIPHRDKLSDQLFLSKWGSKIIRPVLDKYDRSLSQNLGLNEKQLTIYCDKISEILELLKVEFPEVMFIDVRFVENVKQNVVINHRYGSNKSYVTPVIKNLEFSSYQWAENTKTDFKLIDKVTNGKAGVNAFQMEISNQLFEADPATALRIFEEAIIFSHLSVTGKI